ncbi:MAG: hypothetical protein WC028_20620 [Candidatus Obscuribacterales bacterium]
MKNVILLVLIAGTVSSANAQGLKSTVDSKCISHNELRLVAGTTDAARWANLAKIGPTLIGSTRRSVETTLGKGLYDTLTQTLKYSMSTISGRAAGETLTLITLKFKDGRVARFRIESESSR